MTRDILATLVPALPLAGAILVAALRRKLKGNSAGILATLMVAGSFVCSAMLFIGQEFVSVMHAANMHQQDAQEGGTHIVKLFDWINVSTMKVPFAFQIDALSITMILIVTGVGSLIHLYSIGYMHDDERVASFFSMLNLFTFAMLLLVMGANFVVTYIGWEGVGLCSYLLIGFWYRTPAYNYAARKAFVMNRIGDLGFVIGLMWLFSTLGTLNYTEVMARAGSLSTEAVTGITLLLFVGAIGKSAQLPLFTWLPDAMAGPTPVSALIHAATMVTAGIFLLVRSSALFMFAPFTQDVVLWTGLITSLLTASIGVFQNDIKKVLAYSTVSQLGLMFVALGVGAYSAAMFHVTTHAFFKALLFLGAGSVIHALGGEQDIRKMGGLKGVTKVTYVTFLIGTLAIAGIPGLSGFFSKDAILAAAYEAHPAIWAVSLLISLLTCFYNMFRLVFVVFTGPAKSQGPDHAHESPAVMTMPLLALSVPSVLAGFWGLERVLAAQYGAVDGAAEGGWLHRVIEPFEQAPVAATSGLLAVAVGFVLAWLLYRGAVRDPLPARLGSAARWMRERFYFDELYARLIAATQDAAAFLLDLADRWLLAGAVVKGISGVVRLWGELLRRVQTGSLQVYATLFALGVVVVLWFMNPR